MSNDLKSPDSAQITNAGAEEKEKLDCLVNSLAHDYAKYLKVDITKEKTALGEEVEDVLTRLDEFTSLVDMVRQDSILCLNQTLPEIEKQREEFEKMFEMVDKLEQMVQVIKQNLDAMEEKVYEAEQQLDSSSVKKLFNSLQKPLFSKKMEEPKRQLKYDPPEIFQTEDFFNCPSAKVSSLEDKPES